MARDLFPGTMKGFKNPIKPKRLQGKIGGPMAPKARAPRGGKKMKAR